MKIIVTKTAQELGQVAAKEVAQAINAAIEKNGEARIAVSTGASQFELLSALVGEDIDWSRVVMFHLDEYVGLSESHPASFRKYLKERLVSKTAMGKAYFVNGEGDVEENIAQLTAAITQRPIDVGLIGIGENGHVAFNDPPADFESQASYKVVNLDLRCRKQQVGEGWFAGVEDVPKQAISMTVAQIMRCKKIFSFVPYAVKAEAIRNTLASGAVTPMIPATKLREHADCTLYLDEESSALCEKEWLAPHTLEVMQRYHDGIEHYLRRILLEEGAHIDAAADVLAKQIAQDKLINVWGPGGHSNLASQEVFFRAGGLMHINAILDGGTLISNGALRSMKIERLPGYGKVVVDSNNIAQGDVLVLVNAYGINSALIDAALEAKARGATVIGVSSVEHARNTPADHPARHPSKKSLHEIDDIHIDSKIMSGDALVQIEGITQKSGALSTFTNAFAMQSLMLRTLEKLSEMGIEPPMWRSGNAPGGDAWNNQFIKRFQGKIKWL